MFSVGEKVVCINTFTAREEQKLGEMYPVKGEMYTIRTISFEEGRYWLRFNEIINPLLNYRDGVNEGKYYSEAFRKLDYSFAEEVIANLKEKTLTNYD